MNLKNHTIFENCVANTVKEDDVHLLKATRFLKRIPTV